MCIYMGYIAKMSVPRGYIDTLLKKKRGYIDNIRDMYEGGNNECKNYLWRDRRVSGDHSFTPRVILKPPTLLHELWMG